MISTVLTTPLADILARPERVPLALGQAAATQLGLSALEHMEGTPTERDVQCLALYAARHDENAPARDALVAVLLNASGTLDIALAAYARDVIMYTDWGPGRETPALTQNPTVDAVPRRQALAERLMAERARRLRPKMHEFVEAVLAGMPDAAVVPSWFLERNWSDLRDTLVQRVRHEPMQREAIVSWAAGQPASVRARLKALETALIDVTTQEILHMPERAPLAPYCGDDRVADGVRTAVHFRGDPARARLAKYLARLTPGTHWHATISAMMIPPKDPWVL